MEIDEASRRKPGWAGGRAVLLGDGQAWTFPAPRLRLTPRFDGAGGRCRAAVGRAGLPDYDRWYAVITGAEKPPADEYWAARMEAAAAMLRLNYDLADAELEVLLAFEADGPDGPYATMWGEIDLAVMGVLPKA